jgi:hypothetical protein
VPLPSFGQPVTVDQPLQQLLSNGLLGTVCVLLILTVIWLFRLLQQSQAERIKDLLDFKAAIDTNTRSNEKIVDAVQQLDQRIDRLPEALQRRGG